MSNFKGQPSMIRLKKGKLGRSGHYRPRLGLGTSPKRHRITLNPFDKSDTHEGIQVVYLGNNMVRIINHARFMPEGLSIKDAPKKVTDAQLRTLMAFM